jgi:DNA-binding transcriptional ArsR family regulator
MNLSKRNESKIIKKANQLEYIVKGFANKRRINILFLLERTPELSVSEVAEHFSISFVSVSNHLSKMMSRGLVMKRNDKKEVRHALTKKGIVVAKFLRKI